MAQNLAFFADGTWDTPRENSNVVQLFHAALQQENLQLAAYDSGIGVCIDPLRRLIGGAIGAGLFEKIKSGYRWLSARYQPGDRIYLVGFSRGAYTVRSLAGLIALCGLPTTGVTDPKCADIAFEAYRNQKHRPMLLETLVETYRTVPTEIQFLGVWDTVGALGIPALLGGVDSALYGFLDTALHPSVRNAAQALAIDEQRLQFQPTLWTSPPVPGQTLRQLWFVGSHGDVGGGDAPDNENRLLARIPLHWMAHVAQSVGLLVDENALRPEPVAGDALAALHNSATGLYWFTKRRRSIPPTSTLSPTVAQRIETPASHYAPANLDLDAGHLAPGYVLETT